MFLQHIPALFRGSSLTEAKGPLPPRNLFSGMVFMITFIEREHEEKITKRQLKRQSSSELTSEDGMLHSLICNIVYIGLPKYIPIGTPKLILHALLNL